MATWTLKLDPSAVAVNRAELDLNNVTGGIRISNAGVDWGDAAITSFLADQKYGSYPVDFRIPNRQIAIPLTIFTTELGTSVETTRRLLDQKVGLLHREGGWLMRQRGAGSPLYADIVDAALHVPDVWGETAGIETEVVLTLQCLPDFYGDEVTTDVITGTQYVDDILKIGGVQAVIPGDYPARARIVVTDTSGNNQKGLLWALRSRYYDGSTATSNAKIVKTATDMVAISGSTKPTQSGTTSGVVIQNAFINGDGWVPMASVSPNAAPTQGLTHKGSYRVICRVQGVTNPTQLQFLWQGGPLTAVPEQNDIVDITGDATTNEGAPAYYMLDLGSIRLDAPPTTGTWNWFGAIQAFAPGLTTGSNTTVSIDALYFLPLDDGAGRLSALTHRIGFGSPEASAEKDLPGTSVDGTSVGSQAWQLNALPGNLAEVNASMLAGYPGYSTAAFDTHYYKATNFGFSIPTTATIQGIQVAIRRLVTGTAAVTDKYVRLNVNGIAVTPGKSTSGTWPKTAGWVTFGGPTDLWGQTAASLSPSGTTGVNGSTFGVAIAAHIDPSISNSWFDAMIKDVHVTVFYQLPNGLTVASDAVVYANRSTEIRTEGCFRTDASGTYTAPVATVVGDLPRIPPSGAENRPCEVFVDTSRGDFVTQPDTNLDALSVQTFFRPTYVDRI